PTLSTADLLPFRPAHPSGAERRAPDSPPGPYTCLCPSHGLDVAAIPLVPPLSVPAETKAIPPPPQPAPLAIEERIRAAIIEWVAIEPPCYFPTISPSARSSTAWPLCSGGLHHVHHHHRTQPHRRPLAIGQRRPLREPQPSPRKRSARRLPKQQRRRGAA